MGSRLGSLAALSLTLSGVFLAFKMNPRVTTTHTTATPVSVVQHARQAPTAPAASTPPDQLTPLIVDRDVLFGHGDARISPDPPQPQSLSASHSKDHPEMEDAEAR